MLELRCATCDQPFSVKPARRNSAKFCSRRCYALARRGHPHPTKRPIILTCAGCGKEFPSCPSRIKRGEKYCGCACANKHQRHVSWNKGKTRASDRRIAATAEAVSRYYREHPTHNRGENHFRRYIPVSEATRARMRAVRAGQTVTPGMLAALEGGRTYFKGRTKENDASVARRAQILSAKYSGKPNPAHGERLRRLFEQHPERHPNFIRRERGYETQPERIMRQALSGTTLRFEAQFHIGRYFGDFALPDHHTIIEVDGEYWHDPVRDAKRDADIAALGWRVVRFPASRVTKDVQSCLAELLDLVQG
jgi:very-short-patch-repair endonuclease